MMHRLRNLGTKCIFIVYGAKWHILKFFGICCWLNLFCFFEYRRLCTSRYVEIKSAFKMIVLTWCNDPKTIRTSFLKKVVTLTGVAANFSSTTWEFQGRKLGASYPFFSFTWPQRRLPGPGLVRYVPAAAYASTRGCIEEAHYQLLSLPDDAWRARRPAHQLCSANRSIEFLETGRGTTRFPLVNHRN